ncbi:MAG: ABC transporter permease [Candidatus Parvarchaeum sp.]
MEIKPFYAFFTAQLRLIRNKIIAFSFLTVILIVGFSFLAMKGSFDTAEFFESFGLIVWLMIGLIGSNVSANIGVSDFYEKTGLLILTQPVDRKTIITAKILASFTSMLLPLIIIYLTGLLSGFLIYREIMPNALLSFGLSLLYTLSFISFVIGVGTISKERSTPLTVGLTVSMLAVFVFAVFGKLLGIEPWFFLPYGGLIISSIVTVPTLSHINPGNFFFYYIPYLWEAVVIMIVYLCIFLSISLFSYSKREVTK